jgi:SAM-dependent methyltransferase
MNESELKCNPSLNNGYTVQDLNKNPSLTQFSSNTFDAVLCSVSVDYLINPLKVFNDIGRILKPNGQFITSFSNRCFPTKVIGKWLKMNEKQRVEWIANYFLLTNTYFDTNTVRAYSFFDDTFLPTSENEFSDPMYIVLGHKKTV